MKINFKGIIRNNTRIQSLIEFLDSSNDKQLWNYMGLKVEIDPIVDYTCENILIRWTDVVEGFNDKFVVNSLNEFNLEFKPVN